MRDDKPYRTLSAVSLANALDKEVREGNSTDESVARVMVYVFALKDCADLPLVAETHKRGLAYVKQHLDQPTDQ